jgi:hypothetical protein
VQHASPSLYAVPGGIHSLSGPALRDLLSAVLARGASLRFRAIGFSMEPFVGDGDVVTMAPPGDATVRVGAVAAFLYPDSGRLVLHRVVARSAGDVVLRGDNCREPDGVLKESEVLGVVSRVERAGRRVAFGQGPERRLIAALSRRGALMPVVAVARRVRRALTPSVRASQGRNSS